MGEPSPEQVVAEVVETLKVTMRERDVEGTLALFSDDAILFGADEWEETEGLDELRSFLERISLAPACSPGPS